MEPTQLDFQRMQEKEPQERLEGEQEGEELGEKEKQAQEGEEQERKPDQNQLNGLDSTTYSEELPEQIRFFDIYFNRSMKQYTIATLQKRVPTWYDLSLVQRRPIVTKIGK
jgi:hypothetical protein